MGEGDGVWVVVSGVVFAGLALGFWPWLRQVERGRRREKLMGGPFPPVWEGLLRERWHLYRQMPEAVRQGLRERIQVLAAEKRFEPCGSLPEVTEEMKVLILAQAALLLLVPGSRDFFPLLRSILVYPGAYRDRARRQFGWDNEEEGWGGGLRLGESWASGSVVLSWMSVKRGAEGRYDGVNVVLHEFAHQLDQSEGRGEGVPELDTLADFERWARVFQRRFEEMAAQVAHGREPLLDEYGATDPAEFFAVATEAFFESPRRIQREMGDLYEELRRYYALDPAVWKGGGMKDEG